MILIWRSILLSLYQTWLSLFPFKHTNMTNDFISWLLFISPALICNCLPATLFGNDPFSVVWNGASEKCRENFGIEFNLSAYSIEDNAGDSFYGDKMVIFYKNELGKYPRVLPNGFEINGGIPQLAPLQDHLRAASSDINNAIPNEAFSGLSVIDWESWRPLFVHNFDSKRIYKFLSKQLVRQKHPNWNKRQVKLKAMHDFNKAAKHFMWSTLNRAITLRSSGRWGFYGFPRCYKHHCITTRIDNNRLGWMFSASTGLYPSIYLKHQTDSWVKKAQFVHETLQETFRVFRRFSSMNKSVIVPYTRFRYEDPEQLYNKAELLITIVIPAITGSAGVVLWDSSVNFEDEALCRSTERYLSRTLGPFVVTLTDFLKNCSRQQCNNQGRCVKRHAFVVQPNISSYLLHTAGRLWRVLRSLMYSQYSWLHQWHNKSQPDFSVSDILHSYDYTCQCYPGWGGTSCNVTSHA